jgi:uncharacterized membrane protein YkvA (DUF1232 family)
MLHNPAPTATADGSAAAEELSRCRDFDDSGVMSLRDWARALKRDVIAIWIAARDPRTPWPVRALAAGVAAYALSPIDLIPDFIPVLGLLDDLILVPLGLWLCVRLMPPDLMAEFRATAATLAAQPYSRNAALIVIAVWITSLAFVGWLLWRWLSQSPA